jgi:N-acetylglucosaminyldiphosphoundecaprenol N-acetyl-beta-D-mannosaminyltransferase
MKSREGRPAAHVLGVDVDAIDMEGALERVTASLNSSHKSYVCVAGVHGVMEAQRNPQLLEVYAGSEMTIPDGMPLAWVGRMQGNHAMQRVTGPDLMLEVFRRKEFEHVTHFFYGGREGIAKELRHKLTARFPWVKIVGTYTPPFRELSDPEAAEFIDTICRLKPDIIWIGISCPKQELFMARYLSELNTKLMFGVGAAFDYHTGHIRDCADWIKRAGLQWLHRLLQDPRRLWKRYLRNNPAFLWHITRQMLMGRSSTPGWQVRAPETRRQVQQREGSRVCDRARQTLTID